MPLTLQQQASRIRTRYPKARIGYYEAYGGKCLEVSLTLQALPTYSAYRVQLLYVLESSPRVQVLDPSPVKQRSGVPTPHLNPDESLCLFDPDKREWSPDQMIADTTIPWTLRWLLHYESWLSTGVWLGDTEAPTSVTDLALDPVVVEGHK